MFILIRSIVVILIFPLFATIALANDCNKQLLATAPNTRFANPDNPDAPIEQMVKDKHTDLIWTRCPVGAHYEADPNTGISICLGQAEEKTWLEALALVKSIKQKGYEGHHDWRLPNIKELASIVERSCGSFFGGIALNTEIFPDLQTRAGKDYSFWSATPYIADNTKAWAVSLVNQWGYDDGAAQKAKKYIYLVRGAQTAKKMAQTAKLTAEIQGIGSVWCNGLGISNDDPLFNSNGFNSTLSLNKNRHFWRLQKNHSVSCHAAGGVGMYFDEIWPSTSGCAPSEECLFNIEQDSTLSLNFKPIADLAFCQNSEEPQNLQMSKNDFTLKGKWQALSGDIKRYFLYFSTDANISDHPEEHRLYPSRKTEITLPEALDLNYGTTYYARVFAIGEENNQLCRTKSSDIASVRWGH